jgi:hypothetical protein
MEVRWIMISVKHANNNTKENADCRHGSFPRNDEGQVSNLPLQPTLIYCDRFVYAFPASFNARSTFSGLSGSFVRRTPVALKIALAMHAIGGTQAISPAPLAP